MFFRFFGPPDVDRMVVKGDVAGLVKAAQSPGDTTRREKAVAALGRLTHRRALEPLIHLLHVTRDRELACAAVEALGNIGDPRAYGPLLAAEYRALSEDDDDTLAAIAIALGRIGDDQALDHLLDRRDKWPGGVCDEGILLIGLNALRTLSTNPSAVEERRAVSALRKLVEVGLAEALTDRLAACDATRHFALAEALPRIGDTESLFPYPIEFLTTECELAVATSAVRSLGKAADPYALSLLQGFFVDRAQMVWRTAGLELDRLQPESSRSLVPDIRFSVTDGTEQRLALLERLVAERKPQSVLVLGPGAHEFASVEELKGRFWPEYQLRVNRNCELLWLVDSLQSLQSGQAPKSILLSNFPSEFEYGIATRYRSSATGEQVVRAPADCSLLPYDAATVSPNVLVLWRGVAPISYLETVNAYMFQGRSGAAAFYCVIDLVIDRGNLLTAEFTALQEHVAAGDASAVARKIAERMDEAGQEWFGGVLQ